MLDDLEKVAAMSPPPLRVGLIGVTGYALAYYEELNKLVKAGKVEWRAVTIINRNTASEQVAFFKSKGIPIYDDYRTMLDREKGNIDWLCVPTAIEWHARMTIDALEAGIPVLLEKPIAPTLQDVDRIQAAERASGQLVAIGFQHQYSPSTWELKQRLVEGAIGRIVEVDSLCLWPRARSYYSRNDWGGRLFVNDEWVLDSPLHNAISHIVNLILFLTGGTLEGRADPVRVEAELYRSKPIQSYDTVRSQVQLDTGAKAGILLSHSSRSTVDPEIRIRGTEGTLTWRFGGSHTIETASDRKSIAQEDPLCCRERMFADIVARLQGDSSARICTTAQARGEVKWVNAVQDAAVIHDIPEAFRRTVEDGSGEVYDIIEEIDSLALEAYQRSCWFGDLKAPWSVSPGSLDLAGYVAFQGLTIPAPMPDLASPMR